MRTAPRVSGPSGLRLRLLSPPSEASSRITQDDVLFGYRLQLFALAAERGVSEACRLMGVNRSTSHRWKPEVERAGLEMLRPRERRRPRMPNQLSALLEHKIVAFALGHPGLGRAGSPLGWRDRSGRAAGLA